MLYIFQQLVDFIFPRPEAVKLLEGVTERQTKELFRLHQISGITALSSYENPIIKSAITANKFYKYERAASLLSPLVMKYLETLPLKPTVLVAIPLSKQREKERGYNQVLRILQFVKTKNKINIDTTLLEKVLDTTPQTSLNRTARLANPKGAFVAKISKPFPYKRIIIVDDVVTTGATLSEAKKSLLTQAPKDCEIISLAIAH